MNKKRILILGGSIFQIPFVKAAKKRNLIVGLVDINCEAPAREYADSFFQSSVKDCESVLKIARDFKPDGITVGMVDIAVPTCAYVASKLGLPSMSLNASQLASNKYLMIKAFESFNVPHPKYQYISHEQLKSVSIYDLCFPLIVKPVDMAGSRGVCLIKNKEELCVALKESSAMGDSGDILIEEFLEGPEVSVEIIIKNYQANVIQITDKKTSGPPNFAETGHLQPSQLPTLTIIKIKEVAKRAAESLGVNNGIAHAELRITQDGPKMIEIGARAGGDGIAEQLIELSTGISFVDISLKIALGEDFNIPEASKNNSSCILFIHSNSGVLTDVQGLESAKRIEDIIEVKFLGEKGKKYTSLVENGSRVAYVISCSTNAQMAYKRCLEAVNSIMINYSI